MRILIADTFPDSYRAMLAERGHECAHEPDLTGDDLPDQITGFDVLIVRSTTVSAAVIDAADTLGVIIRAGAGTNTIDHEAATRAGIAVCNVPGRNAVAVAELAFGLLLAIDRNIPDNVADLRAGRWEKKRYAQARGIFGRRIGVLGLGQIGCAFAERAKAFGTEVYAIAKPDRSRASTKRLHEIGIELLPDLDALADTCDVLSFHLPATTETTGLVGRQLLERVQPGTIILNTARGEIIDEDALIEAMDSKGVRAGIDVFSDEPKQSTGTVQSRLAQHPNVYTTHHIGASTEQAQEAIAGEVVTMIDALEQGTVLHRVNRHASNDRAGNDSLVTSMRAATVS